MELIEGCSLRNLMETFKGQRMAPEQMRSYFRQMLQGVEHCHSTGVIHRDIKPANLMLTTNGTLKLVDFGVAEILDMFADDTQVIGMRTRGSPAFQPPEVASGKGGLGTAIDVWSAGVTLFFAVTGDVPFSGKSVEALYQAIIEQPLVLPGWLESENEGLSSLISRMLQKSEVNRPGIDELLHDPWVEDPAGDKLYPPQVTQAWNNTKTVTSKLEGIYGESFLEADLNADEPTQESTESTRISESDLHPVPPTVGETGSKSIDASSSSEPWTGTPDASVVRMSPGRSEPVDRRSRNQVVSSGETRSWCGLASHPSCNLS